jgi:hypothetical protein
MITPLAQVQGVREPSSALQVLNSRETAVVVALVVAQFLFAHGGVWARLGDLDQSILYSYVTIPFVVLALLWSKQSVSLGAWALHTLEITCWKFGLTATLLVGMLALTS